MSKGLKKNSPQAGNLAQRLAFQRNQRDEDCRFFGRVFQMDMVTIALGRLGRRAKTFDTLDKMLTQVCNEYSQDILTDFKTDRDMWYVKAALDREIVKYVGKDRFVPWEDRYSFERNKPVMMTHGTDIRSMSYKDLAHFLFEWKTDMTEDEILKWLNEPYDWEEKHG